MAVLRLKDFVFRARVSRFMTKPVCCQTACVKPSEYLLEMTIAVGAIRLLPANAVAARQAQRACSCRLWFFALHE